MPHPDQGPPVQRSAWGGVDGNLKIVRGSCEVPGTVSWMCPQAVMVNLLSFAAASIKELTPLTKDASSADLAQSASCAP